MKRIIPIIALALLTTSAVQARSYDDDPANALMYEEANRMSSRPEEPIGSTYNRIFNDNVVVPIPPSTTGPSYYGPNWTYTQEQNCFKDSTIGVMRCYPR